VLGLGFKLLPEVDVLQNRLLLRLCAELLLLLLLVWLVQLQLLLLAFLQPCTLAVPRIEPARLFLLLLLLLQQLGVCASVFSL
jgi:hypothetical protein